MSSVIDPYNAVPKYHQLAGILRKKINDGDWPPQSPIPSERQLETLYSVSRPTIRQAIELLIHEGYLYREHGKGTFVMPQKLQKGLLELTSFSEDLLKRGIKPGQQILEMAYETAPEEVIRKLELPEGTKALRILRVRFGDDIPIGLQTSYVVLKPDQLITREELEEVGSLYKILQEKLHIIPWAADETLEVTLATKEEADLLQVKVGAPLLINERVLWSQERKAVEFVKILYRGDRYRYTMRLSRA
jgi:GntR family transcriptional regulator